MKIVALVLAVLVGMGLGYVGALCIENVQAQAIRPNLIEASRTRTSAVTAPPDPSAAKVAVKKIDPIGPAIKSNTGVWLVDIVMSGNPEPKWMSSRDYATFLDHVGRGGKWILINFCIEKGQKQTFQALDGKKVALSGLLSGAMLCGGKQNFRQSWDHPDYPYHDHLGIFRVTHKKADKWSKKYNCPMPYSLFYLNGEGQAIHACQTKDAWRLGSPASHGCNRVHYQMAPKLFAWAPVDEYRTIKGRAVLVRIETEKVYVVNVSIPSR